MAATANIRFDDETLKVVNARQAQIIIGAGIIIALLTISLAFAALKPRPAVPIYVVAIDAKTGEILSTGKPVNASSALAADIQRNVIERFIEDARSVTGNVDLERDRLNHVYSTARGQALKAIDDYYRADDTHNPMKQALAGAWSEVEIVRCLKQPEPDTWMIEWREADHAAHSEIVTTGDWQASVRVATTADGIFVINLDWQKGA